MLTVDSNGCHACSYLCQILMLRVCALALDSGLETGNLSGTSTLPPWDGIWLVLWPSECHFTLGLLTRSQLAGCLCGLARLAREVTFYVYFGFMLILTSQHCFSHQGKSKHCLYLLAPLSSA